MTSIIDIIDTVFLVCTSRTEGSILLVVVSSEGNQFAQRLVIGTVGSRNSPDGMEAMRHVVDELLQVEHLEVASLLIVERHGISYSTDSRGIVCSKALIIGRGKEGGRSVPVLGRVASEFVVRTRSEGCRCSG